MVHTYSSRSGAPRILSCYKYYNPYHSSPPPPRTIWYEGPECGELAPGPAAPARARRMGDGTKSAFACGFANLVLPVRARGSQLAHDVHIYDTHIIGGASARTPEYAYRRDRIDKCMISSWTAPLLLFALPSFPHPRHLTSVRGIHRGQRQR